MDTLSFLAPAVVGALTSLVVAWITARAALKRTREEIKGQMEADLLRLERTFQERYIEAFHEDPALARLYAKQFRVGYLKVSPKGMASGERHFIAKGIAMTIGRSEQSDIQVVDPTVSRTHAMIEAEDDGVFFTDMSTNGITVNGAPGRAHKKTLSDGDRFALGDFEAVFHTLS